MKNVFLFPIVIVALSGTALVSIACSETKVVSGGGSGAPDAQAEEEDAGDPQDDAGGSSSGGTKCTQARETTLLPLSKVSKAEVTVVTDESGVKTIYVDASAGGNAQAASNPRVYIKLSDGSRVDVSDKDAFASTEWDLAMKRQVLWTNSGDTGPGKGGGASVEKDFDDVTAADADKAGVTAEELFDGQCELITDQIGDPQTSFTGWYDYDEASMKASARAGVTYIVKAADGTRYKVGIVSYTGKPDGTTTAPATGFFLLKVAPI